MKPGRKFFTKAHSLDKVPTLKRKVYPAGPGIAVSLGPGKGVLVAAASWIARQTGAQKGGLTIQAAGTAHQWTPETAQKAALRRWKTRTKVSKRLGIRLGGKIKNAPQVKHAPLRHLFSRCEPIAGVWYDPSMQIWVADGRKISERAALIRLGYLPSRRKGWVPAMQNSDALRSADEKEAK
jgi:hypothetical protein